MFCLNEIIILVTRVRSHGYVQLILNVVTKDMESLGYRIQRKHSSQTSKEQSSDYNHISS